MPRLGQPRSALAPRVVFASFAAIALAVACGQATSSSSGDGGAVEDGGTVPRVDAAQAPGLDAAAPPDAPAVGPNDASGGSDDGALDGAATDAGPCGVRSGQRGLTSRSMTVAGLSRTYLVYLPASLDPTKPLPFVFVHHGYTMSGQAMYDVTGYSSLADSEGFGVAFPDGQSGPNSLGAPWNVGTNPCTTFFGPPPNATGDDFAFLDAMEADVQKDQCVDATHLYVVGFSMGGYFAHHVGCMRPDIRAVSAHSGGTHDFSTCVTGHKPILILHGDGDGIVPDGCDVPDASNTPSGFTPSAMEWAAKNGCSTAATTVAVENGSCSYYQGCPADGQVALCVFSGMGHCWAGGSAEAGVYSCPGYASATELQWQFFKTYAW